MADLLSVNEMVHALDVCSKNMTFEPLVEGVRAVLAKEGIEFERLQLPMTQPLGFRHPTLWGVLLTWSGKEKGTARTLISHERARANDLPSSTRMNSQMTDSPPSSPYHLVAGDRDWLFQCELLSPPVDFPIFETMRSEGLRHYICFRLNTPGSITQGVVSLASAKPFPTDVRNRLEPLRGLIGLGCYAACRTSQAHQIASCYVGAITGPKVLDGHMIRGSSEVIKAGVMFCDIRGFTALSEELGSGILPVVNQLFEVVGEEAEKRGGEILKFIGDAVLLIFRLEESSNKAVSEAMLGTVLASRDRIEQVGQAFGHKLAVGFGCHIGEVEYGNIGTSSRLDFTVMGPSVNLSSRLESMCKSLGATAVFSEAVKTHCSSLEYAGQHPLKGIDSLTPLWMLPRDDDAGQRQAGTSITAAEPKGGEQIEY